MNYILKLIFGKEKKEKKKSVLKEFLDDPDSFTYHFKVVNGNEIVISIKREEAE